tara:strand:- start:159 stop:596 length:438 start_codon:yes stop_codon:yes gene_type:complete
MREKGKAEKTKKFKEIVTKGFHPYKLPITDARGKTDMVEFVATLVELVPDYESCDTCEKYLSDGEVEMSPYIISCNHEKYTTEKINDRIMRYDCSDCGGTWKPKPDSPYWEPIGIQEKICFECVSDIFEVEIGMETSWYGEVKLI